MRRAQRGNHCGRAGRSPGTPGAKLAPMDRRTGAGACEMSELDLATWTTTGVTLRQALETIAPILGESIGLLYSPRACRFVVHTDGRLSDERARPIDVDGFFEARIFNA